MRLKDMGIKDSEIDWIGKVPSTWCEVLLKHAVEIRNGCDYKHIESDDGIPVIGSGGQFAFATQTMYNGEVLFLGRKGTIDRPLYFNGPFWAVDTMFYGIATREFDTKYLYYYATQFPYDKIATKTALPSMTQTKLGCLRLMVPGIEVQRRIVAYLDKQTAAIDSRVAVLEQKLAAYTRLKASVINRAVTRGLNPKAKLQDSGDEWIGKIPVGWDAVKVESHYDVQLGKMLSAKQSDAREIMLEYVCAANVHYDGVSLNGLKQMWYLPKEVETFRVETGDLLVVEGGAGAGGCSVAENVDRVVCMQNSILRIRPTSTGSNRFLNYWFNDLGHRGYIGCACNVATIPHFTKEKMRQTPMPYPPPPEQIAIADYLDAECAKIDKMAELVTREIELYKKLKRSLINEVVTGKREVA